MAHAAVEIVELAAPLPFIVFKNIVLILHSHYFFLMFYHFLSQV